MAFAPIGQEKTQYAGTIAAIAGLGAAAAAHFTGKSLLGLANKHIVAGSLATAGLGLVGVGAGRYRSSIANAAIKKPTDDRKDGSGAFFFAYPVLKETKTV